MNTNASTGLFGANNTNQQSSIFGAANAMSNQNKPAIGGGGLFANAQVPSAGGIFGQAGNASSQANMFGINQQQQSGTAQTNNAFNLFGKQPNQQMGAAGFVGVNQVQPQNVNGTFSIKYNITTVDEPSFNKQGGQQKPAPIKMLSITAMNEYMHKSIEELRMEDYKLKKSGMVPNQMNMTQGLFGNAQNPQQGVFGGNAPAANNLFGQQNPNALGQNTIGGLGNSLLNANANASNNLFGNKPAMGNFQSGLGQPNNQGFSLFGNQQNAPNSTQAGGLFGNQQAPNQQANAAGGLFNNQQNKPTGGLFGSNISQGIGGQQNSLFGNASQPQQQQQTGLFGGMNLNQQAQNSTANTTQQGGLGLFGNTAPNQNAQAPASGLFGNQGQQQPPSSGSSLFGNTQQNNLIGGAQNPAANSLFGNAANTAGTGLFTNQQNKPGNTSLFGNQAGGQPATTQGQSLFGNAPPAVNQQQGGGLFSSNTGGLFSSANNNQQGASTLFSKPSFGPTTQQSGGSLFGNTNATAAPGNPLFGSNVGGGTSLFSSNTAGNAPASASLFGNNDAFKGGLFSQNNASSAGNLGASNLGGGLFSNNAQCAANPALAGQANQNAAVPHAPINAFLDLANIGNRKTIEQMLENIQNEYIEEQFNNSFRKICSKTANTDLYKEELKRFHPDIPFDMQQSISLLGEYPYNKHSSLANKQDFNLYENFLKSKRISNYGKRFDLLESSLPDQGRVSTSNTNFNIFKQLQLKKEMEMLKSLNITKEEIEKNISKSRANKLSQLQKSHAEALNNLRNLELKRNYSKDASPAFASETNHFASSNLNILQDEVDHLILDKHEDGHFEDLQDIYEIKVILQDPIKFTTIIKILKNKSIILLKKTIANELFDRNPILFRKIKEDQFLLMKNYSIVREDNNTIESAKINNGDIIYILFHERFEKIKISKEESKETSQNINNATSSTGRLVRKESSNSNQVSEQKKKRASKSKEHLRDAKNELAPIEKLPKIEKLGYYTIPSYKEICRMTLKELENIKDFTIYNENGKIIFEGITNLCELNVDQIVSINPREITLYKNGKNNITPEVGKGLNKPAIITMNKLHPENVCQDYDPKEDYPKIIAALDELCKNMGVIIFL